MLKQVGITALRSPTGEFLPAVPIYKEVPEETKADAITEGELARLFVDRIRQCRNAEKEARERCNQR